jgi:hypothetical protein
MKIRTLKLLMSTCLFIVMPNLSGQIRPLTIFVRPVPKGSENAKRIEVTLASTQELHFPCSDVSMLKVYVYTRDGSLARDTEEGAKLKKQQRTPQIPKTVCVSGEMKPGQSVKQQIDIGSLYEMNAPGVYHVRVEMEISGGLTAKSKQIDFPVQ